MDHIEIFPVGNLGEEYIIRFIATCNGKKIPIQIPTFMRYRDSYPTLDLFKELLK